MGTNLTHYHSINITPEDPEEPYPDSIILYGTTDGDAYGIPEIFGVVHKYIEAIMTSDDFLTWDYCDDEELETFTVWNTDGTALWTTSINISYCHANMAIEAKPLIVDGVEYSAAWVGAASIFDAYTETLDEDTDEYVYTYIGSTLNKMIQAELTEDNNYIVTIPRVTGYGHSENVPEGYSIVNEEYIVIIYESEDEDVIFKLQPIGIGQYYPDSEDDE